MSLEINYVYEQAYNSVLFPLKVFVYGLCLCISVLFLQCLACVKDLSSIVLSDCTITINKMCFHSLSGLHLFLYCLLQEFATSRSWQCFLNEGAAALRSQSALSEPSHRSCCILTTTIHPPSSRRLYDYPDNTPKNGHPQRVVLINVGGRLT